jgi:hypothetical protein
MNKIFEIDAELHITASTAKNRQPKYQEFILKIGLQ